jgi:DNA polymerase III alpha subunit (gram-positive type)
MKYIKQLINEEIDLLLKEGFYENPLTTMQDILNSFRDRTLIFFDTETTGISSKADSSQITEIAGVAYLANTAEKLGEFHKKISLNDKVEKARERQVSNPEEVKNMSINSILAMTGYFEENTEFTSEKEAMEGFKEFVSSFQNPLLIAHNAVFDMRQINDALKRNGSSFMPKIRVMDSLGLVKNYIQPLLNILRRGRASNRVQRLLVAMAFPRKEVISMGKGEFSELLNSIPEEELEERHKKYSYLYSSLAHLTAGLKIDLKDWHSAIADTEALAQVVKQLSELMDSYSHFDDRFRMDRDRARRVAIGKERKRNKNLPPRT